MFNITRISVLILLAVSFMIAACGDEYNLTDPEYADWSVIFAKIADGSQGANHNITVKWIGTESRYNQPKRVSVKIAGEDVYLENWGSYWMGKTYLNSGQTYNMNLVIDKRTVCKTTLEVVNAAYAYFPDYYSPVNPAYVTWSLTGGNQFQIASATSFDFTSKQSDNFEEILTPDRRSFSFPAEAVYDYGSTTSYSLEITQMNVKTVNRVILISSQTQHYEYGFGIQSMSESDHNTQFVQRMFDRFQEAKL